MSILRTHGKTLLGRTRPVIIGLGAVALTALTACGNDNDDDNNAAAAPFAELIEQGIARYLGVYSPMSTATENGVITHTFGTGDGPLCLDGSAYRMATRNQNSPDLIIMLQGGGARWSTFDAATDNAAAGILGIGIMDIERADNPVKDWNQVYLPYCDGGLHASDKDNDYDNDGTMESPQRGLHNLSAALDVAVSQFPSPRRIVLTGVSGGGFGSTFALPLVRHLYPDVPIELINDSGVGVSKPGDPDFLRLLQDDWNQSAFIPASCSECIADDGHFSNYLDWQLDQDPNVRRAFLSYSRDTTIGTFFLAIGPDAFEAALFEEVMQMEQSHPDRVRYWIPDGAAHTFLFTSLDNTAGGVKLIDWLTAMLNDSDDWVSVRD